MINVTVRPLVILEGDMRHFNTMKCFTPKLNKKELKGLYLQNRNGRQNISLEDVIRTPLISDLILYAVR